MNEVRGSEGVDSSNNNSNPIKGFFSLQLEDFKKLKIQIGLEWENNSNKHFDLSGKASLGLTYDKNGYGANASTEAGISFGNSNTQANIKIEQAFGIMKANIWNYQSKFTTNAYINRGIDSGGASLSGYAKQYSSSIQAGLTFSPSRPISFYLLLGASGVSGSEGVPDRNGMTVDSGARLRHRVYTSNFVNFQQNTSLQRILNSKIGF